MMYTIQEAIQALPPALLNQEVQQRETPHYFFTHGKIQDYFGKLLGKPYQHFIEMHEYVHLVKVLEFIQLANPLVSLSITSHTAFNQPISDFFTAHLASQYRLPTPLFSDIKTCLQEAVMNSIIHGNLQVRHDDAGCGNFQSYISNIVRTIGDTELALKRVSIFAWVSDEHITFCVGDQGHGFSIDQPAPFPTSPYGRGLILIRNMCHRIWQTQPNNIYMQFLRPKA